MTKKTYNPKYDKKVYQYNKKNENITKRYLDYNGKEYPINCGYKAIKKLTKVIKNLENADDEMEKIEELLSAIMGIVQGVEPEDMEEFFRSFDE